MSARTESTALREQVRLDVQQAAQLTEISDQAAYLYGKGVGHPSNAATKKSKSQAEKRAEAGQSGEFTFIDLFSGIGGLRRGFQAIGGKCIFSCEWDKYSRNTYSLNYPDVHEFGVDVREYSKDPDKVPEHDVLLAGFPCQPFSLAGVSKKNALGRPHGFLCDTQGTLFFDLAQIIAHRRPAAFLLENVKNLESHDGGKTFATIKHVLENELNYEVHTRVISSEPWVPQKRERVFIVGFRDKSAFTFEGLEVPSAKPTLGSILEDEVDPKYTLTEHLWNYLKAYKEKHAKAGNGFGCSVFGPGDVARTLSDRVIPWPLSWTVIRPDPATKGGKKVMVTLSASAS